MDSRQPSPYVNVEPYHLHRYVEEQAFRYNSRKDGMAEPESARPPTPYERFVAATKRVLSVTKEELQKRESAYRKRRAKRKSR